MVTDFYSFMDDNTFQETNEQIILTPATAYRIIIGVSHE